MAEIQELAGLGELFDTLVVFENYPVAVAADAAAGGGLRLAGISGHDATHYPLVLTALPGERLQLRLSTIGRDLFDRADVEALAARLIRLLEAAVAEPGRAIGSLDILAPASARRCCGAGTTAILAAMPSPCDAAGAVCGAGCAHARGHRGGVRGRHAELPRA